jgi:WD40 repeat protein
MQDIKIKYHQIIAKYFSDKPLYLDSEEKKPNTRKLVELPWQQTKAEMWDEADKTLCDLTFIEAKCALRMNLMLLDDFRQLLDVLPENLAAKNDEKMKNDRIDRWIKEIVAYSRSWSSRLDIIADGRSVIENEPQLPEPPPVCNILTSDEIESQCEQILKNPSRIDRLNAYLGFLEKEFHSLQLMGTRPVFVVHHAYNYVSAGPIYSDAATRINTIKNPMILRVWQKGDSYNPRPALTKTLEGHLERVNSVDLTPDKRIAVSGSDDGTIRIWDVASGRCVNVIKINQFVKAVCVTPDGRFVASGGRVPNTVRVWKINSGILYRELEGHSGDIECVDMTPDGRRIASSGADKSIRVWDVEKGICLSVFEGHDGSVTRVCIRSDGRSVVSVGLDFTIRIWDVERNECLKTIRQADKKYPSLPLKISEIGVSADWRFIVSTAESQGGWRIWDINTGTCLREIDNSPSAQYLNITPNGQLAITVTSRYWIVPTLVVNIETGKVLRIFKGHTASVNSAKLTPDGRCGITASWDNTLKVWDIERGNCASKKAGDRIEKILVVPNRRQAICMSSKSMRVWDMNSAVFIKESGISIVGQFGISPGCQYVATVSQIGHNVCIWDFESEKLLHEMKGHTERICSISFTSNGQYVISSSYDMTLRVWEVESGICLFIFNHPETKNKGISGFSITPDDKLLIATNYDQIARIWSLESGKCLISIQRDYEQGRGYVFRIMDDGLDKSAGVEFKVIPQLAFAVSRYYHNVFFWNLAGNTGSGFCQWALSIDNQRFSFLKEIISNDTFALVRRNTELILVEIETRKCIQSYYDPIMEYVPKGASGISDFLLTPDGKSVISMTIYDRVLRVWDFKTGLCIAAERIPSGRTLAFDEQYNRILVGTDEGEIQMFDLTGL